MIEQKINNGINLLYINGIEWMSDEPEEHKLQKALANKSYGDVLVAGLGYGLYQNYCKNNPKVKSITTVEIEPEVIHLFRKDLDVVCEDYYKFEPHKKYDTICGDIWTDYRDKEAWDKFVDYSKKFLKEGGQIIGWHEKSI